jgi:hypothetical protein
MTMAARKDAQGSVVLFAIVKVQSHREHIPEDISGRPGVIDAAFFHRRLKSDAETRSAKGNIRS